MPRGVYVRTAAMRPPGSPPRPLEDRFWPKVDKRGPDECWEWKASRYVSGYGQFYIDRGHVHGRAHRVSYELANGPIPDDLFVCHHCDNRACVNPAHLFLGTNTDNMRDMVAKGRRPPNEGERNARAILTEEDVLLLRARNRAGESYARLAREYGMSVSGMGHAIAGLNWRHLPAGTEVSA
jgi:hypothetical protein